MATEAEFVDAIRAHFGEQGSIVIPQVRNGTGFQRQARTADAIVVSTWPSRGIYAHGFEFKDSRTDWLKELKEPAKAEEIGRYCRYWTLVASSSLIVRADELPPAWGLMIVSDGAVKVAVKSPVREVQEPGWLFVAAVLRAASEVVTDEAAVQKRIQKAVNESADRSYKQHRAEIDRATSRLQKEIDDLRACVREFEKASGIRLNSYSPQCNAKIGEAVRFVEEGGISGLRDELRRIASLCERVKHQAEQAAAVGVEGDGNRG